MPEEAKDKKGEKVEQTQVALDSNWIMVILLIIILLFFVAGQ